ncbi:uncharacterized protein LOC126416405 isoform X1 [Schistocerca serialis cubense]|uniref:uncharacterized protein LOC126416405 isoform X1 n=1 Tax=Schistocerca serialis cubense TaxID=2023355 RepID=UPI00214E9728|nr:uncharacterized protein LOC126416405 isoform X1 [Schistocerca serialis cubense]XP_049940071.1 uncharacterized protein LOC126416405 isoform X1 [Schistocerca serialis cubense]XP_049940072.1 uncharacterized protein LOC126416405 isoform X1 [Schistocerca serialis cubense]
MVTQASHMFMEDILSSTPCQMAAVFSLQRWRPYLVLLSTSAHALFLRIVSTKNLVLKEEARQLICSYFVACRRVRPDCLPVGAIETITALSEGHARLSMKSEVCYEDVLPVLRLYEESLYAIFGNSFVSPPPIARQSGLTSMKSLIMQTKTEMEHFSAWIINYIKSVIGVHPFQYCNAEE